MDRIVERSIQQAVTLARSSGAALEETKEQFLREWITQELLAANGNQFRLAPKLGIHRNTLSRYVNVLKIDTYSIRRQATRMRLERMNRIGASLRHG